MKRQNGRCLFYRLEDPSLNVGLSRKGFMAQVEGNRDPRTIAAMRKNRVRHIAGK